MRKRIGALLNRWHRRMPVFRLPLVAPSFDRPIFVDRLCGYRDALRARTGGRNIVRGLATCFGGRVNDDDPRSDCIQRSLEGSSSVGTASSFRGRIEPTGMSSRSSRSSR